MDLEQRVRDLEQRVASLEGGGDGAGESGLLPARKTGTSDAQVLKKVSTRLQDFEAQLQA
eukprot:CAMPEP_0179055874 /NCGR_PEP_ID=MMETSP0796-20121207/23524_1 /TAXON_ID=73915 /ORGANISM="Pyrodinium bahamense, Strain pbaha01" /LENGTH=59 /DNA_ID=CAMNT_0020752537 /DNA_START=71 /DNA_END=246 /DNA_ORIENTATION=-